MASEDAEYRPALSLAYRMLEKMKVVTDKDETAMELYTFPEPSLFIFQQNVPGKPDIPLGSIEIAITRP